MSCCVIYFDARRLFWLGCMGMVVTLPSVSVLGGLLKADEEVRQDEKFRIYFAVPNVM